MSPQVSSASKTERLLNLLIMLLVQRHYVSKERIRAILYADASDDAFEKMFERDKEELRSLGVPIEVGQMDAYFDDEPGYRIRADEFALPEIALESDEAAVVGPGHPGLGARPAGRGHHRRGPQAHRGRASTLDLAALDIAQPRLSADEPSFDVFWEATLARRAGRPSTTAARATTRRSPATSSPGASSATPAAGTSSGSTPTAARSGSSGSPGSSARPRRAGSPGLVRRSRPAPTSARSPAGSRRPRRPRRPSCWSGPGAGAVAAARRAASVEPDVAGPDDATPWDRLHAAQRGPGRRAARASAPTCTSRSRRRCATRSSRGCARPSGAPA